jgi:hypothetical protein
MKNKPLQKSEKKTPKPAGKKNSDAPGGDKQQPNTGEAGDSE